MYGSGILETVPEYDPAIEGSLANATGLDSKEVKLKSGDDFDLSGFDRAPVASEDLASNSVPLDPSLEGLVDENEISSRGREQVVESSLLSLLDDDYNEDTNQELGYSTDTDTSEDSGHSSTHSIARKKLVGSRHSRSGAEDEGDESEDETEILTKRYKHHMKGQSKSGAFKDMSGRERMPVFKRFDSFHVSKGSTIPGLAGKGYASSKGSERGGRRSVSAGAGNHHRNGSNTSKRISRSSRPSNLSYKPGASVNRNGDVVEAQSSNRNSNLSYANSISNQRSAHRGSPSTDTRPRSIPDHLPINTVPLQTEVNMEYDLPTRDSVKLGGDDYDSDASVMSELTVASTKSYNGVYWVKQTAWIMFISVLVLIPGFACRIWTPDTNISGAPVLTWTMMIAIMLLGFLVAKAIVHCIVALIEAFYATNVNVIYYVFGVRKWLRWTFWSIIAVCNWRFTMTYNYEKGSSSFDPVDGHFWWVLSILFCLLVTFIAMAIKSIVVKRMANGYHKKAYFERIQQSLHAEYALAQLSKVHVSPKTSIILPAKPNEKEGLFTTARKIIRPGDGRAFEENIKRVGENGVIDVPECDMNEKNEQLREELAGVEMNNDVSEKQMNKLLRFVRERTLPTGVTSHLSHVDRKSVEEDNNPRHAKHLAKKLFRKLKQKGKKVVEYGDLFRTLEEKRTVREHLRCLT